MVTSIIDELIGVWAQFGDNVFKAWPPFLIAISSFSPN